MSSPLLARTARCAASSARRAPIGRPPRTSSTRHVCRDSISISSSSSPTSHYHSYDHPPSPGPFGDVDRSILAAAYKHVAEHGFSQRAIGLGARDAGFPDISASILPDGQFSLIHYHLVAQRERLAERSRELLTGPDAPASVDDRVAALAWERLMGNRDVVHRWQEVSVSRAPPPLVCNPC